MNPSDRILVPLGPGPVAERAWSWRSLGGVEGWRVVHDRDPVRALATMAEDRPVTMFVVATHGRTGWARVLGGGVTASSVHRTIVPVLVVPGAAPALAPT